MLWEKLTLVFTLLLFFESQSLVMSLFLFFLNKKYLILTAIIILIKEYITLEVKGTLMMIFLIQPLYFADGESDSVCFFSHNHGTSQLQS